MSARYDIFLSYASADAHIASDIADKLKAAGFSCFMSEKDVNPGDRWEQELRDALKAADRILILITPRSKDNKWVLLESGAAWVDGKELIPLAQFVDPQEFVGPLQGSQGRIIETEFQLRGLVRDLLVKGPRRSRRRQALPPESISFRDVLDALGASHRKMIGDKCYPDLVIGIGRLGSVCAGILAAQFGHKPLKVVDCQYKGRGTNRKILTDCSSLIEKDIRGKNVLVMEGTRRTGETFKRVQRKLRTLKPAAVHSFVLFWLTRSGGVPAPDYFGFGPGSVSAVPRLF